MADRRASQSDALRRAAGGHRIPREPPPHWDELTIRFQMFGVAPLRLRPRDRGGPWCRALSAGRRRPPDLSSRWPSIAILTDARRRRETHLSGTRTPPGVIPAER